MSTMNQDRQVAIAKDAKAPPRLAMVRLRWGTAGLAMGLLMAAWTGGLADRYGEPEGVVGTRFVPGTGEQWNV